MTAGRTAESSATNSAGIWETGAARLSSVEIKQGCAGEFLAAQVSAHQPKGTSCSVVRLSHLIKNTKSKPHILDLRFSAEGK